jgi:hypothetical protein
MNSKELTEKLKKLLDITYVQKFNKEKWSYNRIRVKCHTIINNVSKKKNDRDSIAHSDILLNFCTKKSDLFTITITNFVDEIGGHFAITSFLVIVELDEELDEIYSSAIADEFWNLFTCAPREYIIEKLLKRIST